MKMLLTKLHALWCGLVGGHEDLYTIDGKKLFLTCSRCRRQTSGWTV